MLQHLHIQNYAIIDNLDIHFSSGLNIITGETGAGKSILMGALSLILGERADTSVLADKDKKCFIEGTFQSGSAEVKRFLQDSDLDSEPELVIRREISASGKSRAFVNDTPVTLAQLKALSTLLVDLHQQFDTQALGESDFQREVLDALAGNGKELEGYLSVFKAYSTCQKELTAMKEAEEAANKDLDYHQFLFDELEQAHFSHNELEQIESEIRFMSHAENIKESLVQIYYELEESERPLVQELKTLSGRLKSLEKYHPGVTSLVSRIDSLQIELKDIAGEIEGINHAVSYDAEKMQILNDRMTEGYRLLKKHGVTTTAELLAIQEELSGKLQKVSSLAADIIRKEQEAADLRENALKIAGALTQGRTRQVRPLETKVNSLLKRVGMPNAHLKVSLTRTRELGPFGMDNIEFLFNANLPSGAKNADSHFEPLRKVASGGELSRLMLSIKSLVAKSVQLPTLIFDEIDSGISGEAARQVGILLKELAANHQIISITHQPQIAAKADCHFFVYKEIRNNKIVTSIKTLNPDERITTIAVMLSGEKPTAAAFENAKEMIRN
ncbi:MAG: DNA repair protein RecN [Bacteroidota bacterium]|nr:DNA repair protein RecN [Bacteroidota bacterium]